MRTFKLFAFGGSGAKFQAAHANFVRALTDKFGEVTVDPKVMHRDSIYFTPAGYGPTCSCAIMAPNPGRSSYTFGLRLSDLFDGYTKVTADGKTQGTNLFFSVTKTDLPEEISTDIEKMDAKFRQIAAEAGIENPFWSNGSYNSTGMKLKDNGFVLTRLDLGKQFVMAVETVIGKESGLPYNLVSGFWGVTYGRPISGGTAANLGSVEDMLAAAPSPTDLGIAPSVSIEVARQKLTAHSGVVLTKNLTDAEVLQAYHELALAAK